MSCPGRSRPPRPPSSRSPGRSRACSRPMACCQAFRMALALSPWGLQWYRVCCCYWDIPASCLSQEADRVDACFLVATEQPRTPLSTGPPAQMLEVHRPKTQILLDAWRKKLSQAKRAIDEARPSWMPIQFHVHRKICWHLRWCPSLSSQRPSSLG